MDGAGASAEAWVLNHQRSHKSETEHLCPVHEVAIMPKITTPPAAHSSVKGVYR